MGTPTGLRIAGDLTPDLLDTIRCGLSEPGEWDATVVAALVGEIDRMRRIVNNVAVDLNETQYPLELRVERASSHLMECPEAVFGDFPHGPEAARKAGVR